MHCKRFDKTHPLWLRLGFLLFFSLPLIAQVPLPRTPGKPITQKLASGEQQTYLLSLTAEEYCNLTVDYEGVVLSATLRSPQGRTLAEWSGGVDTIGNFEAAIVAPTTGDYQLSLQGRGAANATGLCKISVNAVRPATESDRRYATANRLTLEANTFYDQRTGESRRRALAKYQEALQLYRVNQDVAKEIDTMDMICLLHRLLGEPRQGLSLSQEMITKARQHKLREKELIALRMAGSLYLALDEYQEAKTVLDQSLELSRALQDRQMEQSTLNALGVAVASMGQGQIAIGFYQQALQLARATGDRGSEAGILNNLATRWNQLGEMENVVTAYQQSLSLFRQLSNRDGEARTLRRLSETHLQRGELQQALDYATQSLALAKTIGSRPNEAVALLQMGHIQQVVNNPALALNYLNEARVLYKANENRADEAGCLSEIGLVYLATGELDKAEEALQQALQMQRTINRQEEIADALMKLSVVMLKQGKPQQSLAQLTEVLTLGHHLKSVPIEAMSLLYISRAHQILGERAKALECLQAALPLTQKLNRRRLEAEVQHDLALMTLQQQEYEAAQTAIMAAIQIIETSRISLLHPEARAVYRSSTQSFYELATEVLVQRARQQNDNQLAAQALESVEKARARSLLDLLTESRIDIRQGVAPELLKRERELQIRATAKTQILQTLGNSAAARQQAASLEAERTKVYAELLEVQAQIRRVSPAYAALTLPQPLQLSAIQQQILDPNTLLLEYALGTERSYLFAVTSASLKVFVLPKRAEIEAAVRQYYEIVEKQSALPVFSSLAQKQTLTQQLEHDRQKIAQTLSQMLLRPAASEFQHQRLLIVPDGALYYVPFAALPEPIAGQETNSNRPPTLANQQQIATRRSGTTAPWSPLILKHEILTLPSASTLVITRQQFADRAAAPKTLAMFADAVFSANDERVVAQTRGVNAEGQEQPFARLLRTRQEAQAITALVPPTQSLVALDFEANRTLALSDQLNQYRYLHFATHGIWNKTAPELSGLLLSQRDAKGQPQNGLLTTRDVFNLKLNSELVVLSGCQTAQGEELRGEGLVGLTRGFMYAGARRVVASLWQVNDVATAKLMEKFYEGMLGKKALSPAAALRAAQIAMSQDKRWGAPHYWAAFVLQGEW